MARITKWHLETATERLNQLMESYPSMKYRYEINNRNGAYYLDTYDKVTDMHRGSILSGKPRDVFSAMNAMILLLLDMGDL